MYNYKGIVPLIITLEHYNCVVEIKIYSVSQKLATSPSESTPLLLNY